MRSAASTVSIMRFRFLRPKAAVPRAQSEAIPTDVPDVPDVAEIADVAIPAQGVPDAERCGKPTKSGSACRWNVAKGPCLTHRETANLMAAFDKVAASTVVRGD